jgi:hypothetical protein
MSAQEQDFDFLSIIARAQFLIMSSSCKIDGSILVSMHDVTAYQTTKRLLVWSILAVYVMARAAFELAPFS